MKTRKCSIALAIMIGFLVCNTVPVMANDTNPQITLTPPKAVYATPFTLTLSGLTPGEEIQLKANSIDKQGVIWKSAAFFMVNREGAVDLDRQAPVRGDYKTKDHLGLLWSMKPVNSKRKLTYYNYDKKKGLIVTFTLTDSKGNQTSQKLYRFYEDPENKLYQIQLDENGLKGFLYSPNTGKRYPGIMLLGGSNGGSVAWLAKALAYHGFSVLDIPYFKYPGLPEQLVNIPVEYFVKAIQWMKSQKTVKPNQIGLVGGSKGGELALLLGSLYDEFKVIVGWVPGAHLWQGEEYTRLVPSWTFKGKSLPFIGEVFSEQELKKLYSGQITSFRGYFLKTLKNLDKSKIQKAAIKVEKIKAPLLLISGSDDQTWPSTEFSQMIIKRLKKHNFKYEYKHFAAENAGHLVFLPDFIPATYRHFNGGTRQAELHQSIRAWKKTINFLHKYLHK